MGDSVGSLLSRLIALATVDESLARLLAERKRLEKELQVKLAEKQAAETQYKAKERTLLELRTKLKRDEGFLKGELEKIVARRKSLSTMGSYKVQQAAEREIDGAAKQLELREEEVLNLMSQVQNIEKEVVDSRKLGDEIAARLELVQNETAPMIEGVDARRAEKEGERAEIARAIDPAILRKYDQVLQRNLMDPLAAMANNSCTGCRMSLGPQMFQKVARGDALIQCPGCARILYIEPKKD